MSKVDDKAASSARLAHPRAAAAATVTPTTPELRQQLARAEATVARLRDELERAEWLAAYEGIKT